MNKPRHTPTLKSIAEAAGVTTMTVSRVLRNQPHVVPEIRQRVLALAEEVGYRPNAFAAALAGYRTEARHAHRANLACLVGHKGLAANPLSVFEHYRLMSYFAQEYAARHGYSMDLMWVHEPGVTPEQIMRTVQARGVAGLVLLSMHSSEIAFPWKHYSCAYISYNNRPTGRLCFPYTTYDIEEDMTVAYNAAAERGYRRIGLVSPPVALGDMQHRTLGAYLAARHLLHPKSNLPVLESNFHPSHEAKAKENFGKWFTKNRPDAIICAMRGASQFFRRWGVRIPEDVGVLEINILKDDGTTGMRRPFAALAEQGVKQVIDQISRNERGEIENAPGIALASEWVEGKTLPGR